jgi:hypothetical protein
MNKLILKQDGNFQWVYKITHPDGSILVDWQYGSFDKEETIAQARGRFGPCEEPVTPPTKMRLTTHGNYNRTLVASGLNDQVRELSIVINYAGGSDINKSVPLDKEVIPRIKSCVNACSELNDPEVDIPNLLRILRNLVIVAETFNGRSEAIQGAITQAEELLAQVNA